MASFDYVSVARSLNAAGFPAEVRGDGGAQFVFAKAAERAVEISESDAGVWIEYWDDNESPKFERTFLNVDVATAHAKAWLSGMAESPSAQQTNIRP